MGFWTGARVEQRVFDMLEQGLLVEVRDLVKKYGSSHRPLQSVGYKECLMHLNNEMADKDLVPAIVKSTMALAKKQLTWFKRDNEIKWFDVDLGIQPAKDFLIDAVNGTTNNR